MSAVEVVVKELQVHQSVPRRIPLGEGMGLAGEGVEPIAQHSIEPLHMDSSGGLGTGPQNHADLCREE